MSEPTVAIPDQIPLPPGFRAGGVHCGLKKNGALDLGILLPDQAVEGAALFTTSRLLGAHIEVCRDHLARSNGMVRAVLVNARNANCATGRQGVEDARTCCRELALRLRCPTEQVLMASTGPIGAPLPTARIVAHLDQLIERAAPDRGIEFARAIMTTDTRPKVAHRSFHTAQATGFAKGAGMIHPDMATMLAFVLTDARTGAGGTMAGLLRRVAERSFQRLTIDGDTSPNDTLLLLASGKAPAEPPVAEAALTQIGTQLARQIAADGEGATRLVTVQVRGAASEQQAVHVGRTIATSPLVKTAVAGRDPNWGRIVSAAARAGVAFVPESCRVWIGGTTLFADGRPLPQNEPDAHRHLQDEPEVVLGIDLGIGAAGADVWTCDLTAAYVQINADYRS